MSVVFYINFYESYFVAVKVENISQLVGRLHILSNTLISCFVKLSL
jgi:hypothetical protein